MKRLLVGLACVAVLNACTMFKRAEPVAVAPVKPVSTQLVDADGVPIETIEFRAGVSSATVENMAKREGCVGGAGAGLVTEPGPVEVYRMICDNRTVYKARCELRQCRKL
jgi:hypothetical protein